MQDEYNRIRGKATEDPGTAGDQGEENWASLLRQWLPASFHVVTKGRIISDHGVAGPQVDVVVLEPSYPRGLLEKKLYLAGAVAAAFECKLTLKRQHLQKTIGNCREIKRLAPPRFGTPYGELTRPPLYGLLAHSHCWKGDASTPRENIEQILYEYDTEAAEHPREMLDLVCVADLETWSACRLSFFSKSTMAHVSPGVEPCEAVHTGFLRRSDHAPPDSTAIGAMVTQLIRKLAWERPWLRDLAQYMVQTEVGHLGQGLLRRWDLNVYSNEVQAQLKSGRPAGGLWDEWLFSLS